MANIPLLSLKDIHITLGEGASRVHILKGVSLDIEAGESVSIVGPSGSGKSTLLMIIAGLESPDSGSLKIDDTEITNLNEDQLARFRGENIGIVFQSFHLMANMTALENVALPLELSGTTNPEKIALEMLEAVGLKDRAGHYPSQLSGGEQQRVAIARALAPKPKILVCDEPTGNLDEDTGQKIIDLLFSLYKEQGMTLVLVTHDNDLAAKADRQIAMHNGVIEKLR